MSDTSTGTDFTVISPRIYQALVIARGLTFYLETGKRVNRAYTPKAMMAMAEKITGRQFKSRAYGAAAAALREWAHNARLG